MEIFKVFLQTLLASTAVAITICLCIIFITMANDVRAIRKKLVTSSETSDQQK